NVSYSANGRPRSGSLDPHSRIIRNCPGRIARASSGACKRMRYVLRASRSLATTATGPWNIDDDMVSRRNPVSPRNRVSFFRLLLLVHEIVHHHAVKVFAVSFDIVGVHFVIDVLLQALVVLEQDEQTEVVVFGSELRRGLLGRPPDPQPPHRWD